MAKEGKRFRQNSSFLCRTTSLSRLLSDIPNPKFGTWAKKKKKSYNRPRPLPNGGQNCRKHGLELNALFPLRTSAAQTQPAEPAWTDVFTCIECLYRIKPLMERCPIAGVTQDEAAENPPTFLLLLNARLWPVAGSSCVVDRGLS